MTHIVVTEEAAERRPRRTRVARQTRIVAVALIALVLAGCAAGGGAASDADVDQGGVGIEDGGSDAAAADADRSVIVEGTMSIVVDDVTEAAGDAMNLVEAAGGRIDGRDERYDQDGEETVAISTMILRIPTESLDAAIDELRKLGTVESLQTATTDVTSDVQDVDARVSALQSTIARLESFQGEATSVSDLLSIEEEIAERQTELESYLTRQADYAEQISFSTITLSLQSTPSSTSAPDTFWSGLVVGWNSLMTFVAGLAVVLGVALPWLLGFGLVAAAIVLLVRWIRRRRPNPPIMPPPGQAIPWIPQDEPAPPAGVGSMPPAP